MTKKIVICKLNFKMMIKNKNLDQNLLIISNNFQIKNKKKYQNLKTLKFLKTIMKNNQIAKMKNKTKNN